MLNLQTIARASRLLVPTSFMVSGAVLLAASVIPAILLPQTAYAYCRTASCANKTIGTQCTPARDGDCGVTLFWPTPCTGFTVQRDSGEGISADTVESLVKQAFASWTTADCGTGHPKMRVDDLGLVTCNKPEYNTALANSNTIMFRGDGWPYPATNTIALTTVTFNVDTGEIRDADMELNSTDITFSTSDTDVTYDLLSILTHETGHFLGMAHSPVDGATMEAAYPPKSLDLRSLSDDDIAGICAIYPPGVAPSTCDSTPKNGLGDECKTPAVAASSSGCCAVAAGTDDDAGAAVTALVLGSALSVLRISRRRVARANRSVRGGLAPRPRA